MSNKILEARIAAGLNRKQMSDKLEIPYSTIQDWELGRRTPPEWVEKLILKELKRIAEND